MQLIKSLSRGDTLIEVMFATAIFSLVAVAGVSIMNRGVSTAQAALEITQVKKQIDAQAETLRFLNSSYISAFGRGATSVPGTPAVEWLNMLNYIDGVNSSNASTFGDGRSCNYYLNTAAAGKSVFVLDAQNAKFYRKGMVAFNLATTTAKVEYNAAGLTSTSGVWVEAVHQKAIASDANQNNADYIDFHIRACWDSPNSAVPITLATIVRLYEPVK